MVENQAFSTSMEEDNSSWSSWFELLSPEIIVAIARHIKDAQLLLRWSRCDKRLNAILSTDDCWRSRYLKTFGTFFLEDLTDIKGLTNWKRRYWVADAIIVKATRTNSHSRRIATEVKRLAAKPCKDILLRVGPHPSNRKEDPMLEAHDEKAHWREMSQLFTSQWTAFLIGPSGSPYEGGVWEITLEVGQDQEYPFRMPRVTLKTPIYHPRVRRNLIGSLERFRYDWTPSILLVNYVQMIYDALFPVAMDEAAYGEPTVIEQFANNREAFDAAARAHTQENASQNYCVIVKALEIVNKAQTDM